MRTTIVIMLMGISMAAETPKPKPATPAPKPIEASKLTSSEVFALQTIADKIGAAQKALDDAKQFQQVLFRDACQGRKIELALCEIRPDMTIAAKVPAVAPAKAEVAK